MEVAPVILDLMNGSSVQEVKVKKRLIEKVVYVLLAKFIWSISFLGNTSVTKGKLSEDLRRV